jgi:hypothetical protein
LTDDPDFLKVRTRERIDPDSHVLLSASGNIGAFGLDGIWKSLSEAVAEHDHLVQLKRALMKVAANTGGQLRTNDIVGLAQALKLYQLPLPSTLEDARTLLQRLEIPCPCLPGPAPTGEPSRRLAHSPRPGRYPHLSASKSWRSAPSSWQTVPARCSDTSANPCWTASPPPMCALRPIT